MFRGRKLTAVAAVAAAAFAASPAAAGTGRDAQEKEVLERINAMRAEDGRKALKFSTKMAKPADAHSKDMAKHNYFSHRDRKGREHRERLRDYGIRGSRLGEILGFAQGLSEIEAVMDAWRKSKIHRGEILNRHYRYVGIGRRVDGRKVLYTVTFANKL